MYNFFQKLFTSGDFMPHGHCYLWHKDVLWLNIVSDGIIALAYYSIPILLIYFIRKRKDITFNWIFVLFSLFIVACGTTHVLEIVNIWIPVYRFTGLVKAITAVVSLITGVHLIYILPQALAIPGPGVLKQANVKLEKEIIERKSLEEKFSGLLESAPDGMIIVNKSAEIVMVNIQTEKLFGYSRAELVGKKIELLIPDKYKNIHKSHRDKYIGDPHVRSMGIGLDLYGLRKDGSEFPIAISLSPTEIAGETLIFSSVRDISEQKHITEKIKHNENLLAEAQQIAHIGSWEWDIINNKIIWTDELYTIYGLKPQVKEVDYASYLQLIHPDDRAMVDEVVTNSFNTQESFTFYHKIIRPDGEIRMMYSSGKVLSDNTGKAIKMTGIGQDVTDSKNAEEKLNVQKENLERKNLELIQYTYIISHDLKAPLRAIGNLAQWLEADYKDKLDEQGKESLALINARVSRMYLLIDGILRHSKIGNEIVELDNIDINTVVNETIGMIDLPADMKIEIETGLPTLRVDKMMISQVFQNLMSNSTKYMDKPNGLIKIGCIEEKDWFKFYVNDNGPGIDSKYHEKIFQIFQTLQARDSVESTGVGLSLAKKIVELSNGKIWVESEVGNGSTFYFTFPKK